MNYYNQGGLADIAQNLANKGRNGDTKLVHMSPKEVRGLQTLAKANGTSLTINPDTGLPEAFRLENLFPMIAGAALTIGSGGTLTPLMAAGLVGGGYGIATGSIEKGLMAGIGAYGGAGLGTGLSAAGASTVAPTAVAPTVVPEVATQTGTQALGEAAATEAFAGANQAANQAAQEYAATEAYAGSGLPANQNAAANQAAQMTAANQPPTFANMGRGLEALGTSEGRSIAYKNMPMGTLPALGTTALTASQQTPNVPGYQEDEYDRRLKGYKLAPNYQPYQAPAPNPYYRPSYAAAGGVMNSYDDEAGMDMAGGGIASLGGYSDGGRMLKGPGDGMSDSIPGVIGGKQPARLADGEFVVPADVVSHLGNGSTDAGAKKLYSMMDKIRQARTGKKKQAPEVNVDKYLPSNKKASGGIAGYAEGGIARYVTGDLVQDTSIRAADDPSNPENSTTGGTTYNQQLAAKVQNAYNQGYSGAQIGAALIASGVSPETAAAATGLSADVIAQVYAGGASLGGNIGDPGPARNVGTTSTAATTTSARYTPQQYLDFLTGLTGAGMTLEAAKQNLRNTYGATDADLYAIADLYNSQNKAKTTATTTKPTTTQPTFTNQQVLDAIKASMAQGFSLEESKQGAMSKYGITPAQLYEVAALYEAQQKFNEASSNSIAAYRPSFVPRPLGIANMPASTIDPYSDQGLQTLYGQMMGQYARPATSGVMSDAEVRSFAEEFTKNNPGKGAELGQALINKGIPVNQVIAATGLSPGTVNTAYIGGQKLGVAPPPTVNTQYNYSDPSTFYRPAPVDNLTLKNPIADAVTAQANQAKADAAAAAQAGDSGGGGGERAGGLMSIDRKKRAKYKT